MPITVQRQPSFGLIGEAAQQAGLADFYRFGAQQRQQQFLQSQQLAATAQRQERDISARQESQRVQLEDLARRETQRIEADAQKAETAFERGKEMIQFELSAKQKAKINSLNEIRSKIQTDPAFNHLSPEQKKDLDMRILLQAEGIKASPSSYAEKPGDAMRQGIYKLTPDGPDMYTNRYGEPTPVPTESKEAIEARKVAAMQREQDRKRQDEAGKALEKLAQDKMAYTMKLFISGDAETMDAARAQAEREYYPIEQSIRNRFQLPPPTEIVTPHTELPGGTTKFAPGLPEEEPQRDVPFVPSPVPIGREVTGDPSAPTAIGREVRGDPSAPRPIGRTDLDFEGKREGLFHFGQAAGQNATVPQLQRLQRLEHRVYVQGRGMTGLEDSKDWKALGKEEKKAILRAMDRDGIIKRFFEKERMRKEIEAGFFGPGDLP